MKKLLLLFVAAFALVACNEAVDGYRVKVKVDGDLAQLTSDTLVLTNRAEGADLITSVAVLSDGVAVFEGASVTTPQNVMITANGADNKRLAVFFLEDGISEVNVVLVEEGRPEVTVKGGKCQTVIDSLAAIKRDIFAAHKIDSLMKNYGKMAEEEKVKFEKLFDSVDTALDNVEKEYVAKERTSLYALNYYLSNIEKVSIEDAEAAVAAFKADVKYAANKNVTKLEELVAKLKALQPGMVAPDFVQNDENGNPVKFSDFYKKNKVTMVDFWASWCSPCRKFNPTLTKIYKEFRKKGFGIIGVSLDRDKEAWLKAIKDDKLVWEHVSDLGYWNNEVAKLYHVRFIPQSILVDQDGKIIKRQASEEELVEILKENLK